MYGKALGHPHLSELGLGVDEHRRRGLSLRCRIDCLQGQNSYCDLEEMHYHGHPDVLCCCMVYRKGPVSCCTLFGASSEEKRMSVRQMRVVLLMQQATNRRAW